MAKFGVMFLQHSIDTIVYRIYVSQFKAKEFEKLLTSHILV